MNGSHHRSLDLVIAGEIDAAVVDSIVRRQRARDSDQVAGLRVVERLGPWPTQPVVMRVDATATEVEAVRDALLRANEDPLVVELLAGAMLTRLAATDADHCARVRLVMAESDR